MRFLLPLAHSAPVGSQCTTFEQWCLRFLEKEFLAFLDRHDLCCNFYSFIYSSTQWHFSSLTYVKEKNQVTSFETHFYIGNKNASEHTHSTAACALPEYPPELMCSSWLTHGRPGPNERLSCLEGGLERPLWRTRAVEMTTSILNNFITKFSPLRNFYLSLCIF